MDYSATRNPTERPEEEGGVSLAAIDGPVEALTPDERICAYRAGLRVRAAITQCLVEMRKGAVRFWIGGPGEEVHGTAVALAIHHVDRAFGDEGAPWHVGLFPHYRSDALGTLLAELRGHDCFTRDYFRQALSRSTDPMSRARQMVMHLCAPELGILPVQSPLGMNLGKAAGWTRGLQLLGRSGAAFAVCGDGTTSTSDFHEAFVAASVWSLPMVICVTDNEVAISVKPVEGRGIRSYQDYAKAFGGRFLECDGYDLDDSYRCTLEALHWSIANQRPCLIRAHVPRLRGHSSSDGAAFDYDARDPLLELGEDLVARGIIAESDVFRRAETVLGRDYFEDHVLGDLMEAERATVASVLEQVRAEPEPEPGDQFEFIHPPYPDVTEPATEGTTAIQLNEALNLCLVRMAREGATAMWGQDIAHEKGGVFKVTRDLSDLFPGQVQNAPINEEMIVGTAVGAALHPGFRAVPEIQFGDYSLNTLHWLVHAGNIYWGSGGRIPINVTLRTPVDPVPGGALYHSMSVDGYFTPVRGWVICCPSTSFDGYGLLRAAGDYAGPVLILEPTVLYRRADGPALPGEPDAAVVRRKRRESGVSLLPLEALDVIEDFRIPFGKAALRRAGADLTVVTYGNAVLQALEAASTLADEDGIDIEVIDLRTLVPWDEEAVLASARRTGRLLVAHQDRPFASFGRHVQAVAHEHIDGLASAMLTTARLAAAARDLARRRIGAWVQNESAWVQLAPGRRSR